MGDPASAMSFNPYSMDDRSVLKTDTLLYSPISLTLNITAHSLVTF